MEMQVNVQGRAAHASSPALGSNAIHHAARLIFGVELLAPRLAYDEFLGQGTAAVTEIQSQAASRNAVPDCCDFFIDRRLTLGETERKALAEIQNIITTEEVEAEVKVTTYRATSYTGYQCRTRNVFPAWAMPQDHALVQTLVRSVRETLGYRPRLGRWSFSTHTGRTNPPQRRGRRSPGLCTAGRGVAGQTVADRQPQP
jgi:putative selenium metabolism hydrolase